MVIPCDTVILAIGQASDLSFLKPEDGIETTRQGTLKINAETLMTSAAARRSSILPLVQEPTNTVSTGIWRSGVPAIRPM